MLNAKTVNCDKCGKQIASSDRYIDQNKIATFRAKNGRHLHYCCESCRKVHYHGNHVIRFHWRGHSHLYGSYGAARHGLPVTAE